MRDFQLEVNGLPVQASYDDQTITEVLGPLVLRWSQLARGLGRRMIVFLAAPPATGKSTLALVLQELSRELDGAMPLTAVGLDGFHHSNEYLQTHRLVQGGREVPLSQIKGAPETFDLAALRAKLVALRSSSKVLMPTYDRRSHDVVPDSVAVTDHIVLVEGNYLLLDEPGWRGLSTYCNDSVFVQAEPSLLHTRLVGRKVRGGSTREEAEAFYEASDRLNVERVLAHRVPASVTLRETEENHLSVVRHA